MNEEELLKEIEDLDKLIETNELLARNLRESDWETLVEWWDWWPGWVAPARDFTPENGTGGIMVDKNNIPIVAGFIYETNSKLCYLEWIVSNPKYKNKKDRKEAIELLITKAEEYTKNLGYTYMWSVGRHKTLIETHRRLDWVVDDKPCHELTKKLK